MRVRSESLQFGGCQQCPRGRSRSATTAGGLVSHCLLFSQRSVQHVVSSDHYSTMCSIRRFARHSAYTCRVRAARSVFPVYLLCKLLPFARVDWTQPGLKIGQKLAIFYIPCKRQTLACQKVRSTTAMDYVDRLRGRTQSFNLNNMLKFTDMYAFFDTLSIHCICL